MGELFSIDVIMQIFYPVSGSSLLIYDIFVERKKFSDDLFREEAMNPRLGELSHLLFFVLT